jgi:hypothetical protein
MNVEKWGCFKRTTPKPQNSEHDCKCADYQPTIDCDNQHVDCKVKKRFHLIFPKLEKMGGFDETRPKLKETSETPFRDPECNFMAAIQKRNSFWIVF